MSEPCFVYVMTNHPDMYPTKIGISRNPRRRAAELQTASPYPIVIHHTFKLLSFSEALRVEQWWKEDEVESKLLGEWYAQEPLHVVEYLAHIIDSQMVKDGWAVSERRARWQIIGWPEHTSTEDFEWASDYWARKC